MTTRRHDSRTIGARRVREWLFAAEAGDLQTMTRLWSTAPQIVDAQGTGPYWEGHFRALHYAVFRGHRKIVRWLIAHGASVNPIDGDADWAPVHFAAVPLRRDLVRLLRSHGANVDIFVAAVAGDVRAVRRLVAANPSLISRRGPDGATPLHFAGSPGVARVLLDAGADSHARDAFHHSTPIEWTIERPRVVRVIANAGEAMDIHVASAIGDVSRVRALLDANPDAVNARIENATKTIGGEGEAPLALAARYGRRRVVALLLRRGARADVTPSPLPGAVHGRDRAMVRLLLDAGADPNGLGAHGHASLHAAAVYGELPMIRLLLSHGARLDLKDQVHKGTPLNWARYHKHNRAAAFLESRGGR